jgi:hypothetical protein
MYQQTRLSDLSAIGAPGDLPEVIATWGDAPALLADLTGHVDPQFGLDGTGFWPVDVTTPAHDPSTEIVIQPTVCEAVDAVGKRWVATATVRAMTDDELRTFNPVPLQVSNLQARRALRANSLFDKVDAAIRGSGNADYVDAWDYAGVFLRDDPVIAAMTALLELSPRQADDLFRQAALYL